MADVLRENGDLKKQYEGLNDKLAQARLSESLESKQKGSQFVIVDPANLPLAPAKPNKAVMILLGLIGSLAAAVGFAAVVDIARQKFWTQSEIEALWGVPVLVEIPEIVTDSDLAVIQKKKFAWTASSLAALGGYGFCLYMMYLKHAFILRQLDPIIKLVYK